MAPLITIALPVYNGVKTLKDAVNSIINQSFRDWELIVLDDASTDDSLDVMHLLDDPRIRLIEGKMNLGLSARLNMAVDIATGVYFARMDQDDVSFPSRLEKQFEYLQQHPSIDLLATSTIPFRGDLEVLGKLPVLRKHEEICARPWNGFSFPHPTWMGRIEWFRQYRYASFSDGVEDQYLLLHTYNKSKFACLDEPLLLYREVDCPLRKKLRARRIFARVFMKYYFVEGSLVKLTRVALLVFMKSVADMLYALLSMRLLRNTLLPLSEKELSMLDDYVSMKEDADE